MFITLLAVTFLIAAAVTTIVALLFKNSITSILQRIFAADVGAAWQRYMTFAIYVVGISGGVRVWELEKYVTGTTTVLDTNRWVLEVYRTIISTLQSTAWLLLVFFLVAIVAYGLVRLVNRDAKVPA